MSSPTPPDSVEPVHPEGGLPPQTETASWKRGRTSLPDVVHYVLLRAAGTDCSLAEVSASRYEQTMPLWPTLEESTLRGLSEEHRTAVANYLEGVEADAKTRYDRIDSKLRTLLGVNGLAFSLITGFSLAGRPLFLFASAPFIISAVLALRALGIHTFQVLSLSDQEIARDVADLRAIQLRGRLAAANANECVVDFTVDCFRAAHRYFVLALSMLPLLYMVGMVTAERKEPLSVAVTVSGIASSAADAVRGPPGPPGSLGPRGPEGPMGQQGPPGPAGALPSTASSAPPRIP